MWLAKAVQAKRGILQQHPQQRFRHSIDDNVPNAKGSHKHTHRSNDPHIFCVFSRAFGLVCFYSLTQIIAPMFHDVHTGTVSKERT